MKTTVSKILIVLLVLSSVLTMAASPNNNRVEFTSFSGTEAFAGLVDPGTMKTPDGKTIVNGLVILEKDTMSDPRVSGDGVTTVNFVYDTPAVGPFVTGTGPLWGTFHLTNASGGWNILFTGHQYAGCHTVIQGRGSGEGAYEGLKVVWDWQSDDCMLTSTVSGYIVEHQ